MPDDGQDGTIVHATTVACGARAVLIRGRSGAGKSALALELMAFGCRLIADDRTVLSARDGVVVASCPAAIRGRIEARGIGILAAEAAGPAPVALVADLDATETQRLPPPRSADLLGLKVPLLYRAEGGHFAAAIRQYLLAGRVD